MRKKTMYEVCPVCYGAKKIRQIQRLMSGEIEVETSCWACRGSGYVDYNEEEVMSESRIREMYATV